MSFPRFLSVLALALTVTLTAQDLGGIKVDNLSDAQIQQMMARGKAQGLSDGDAEAMAASMGLPPEEAAKFKERVSKLDISTKSWADGTVAAS